MKSTFIVACFAGAISANQYNSSYGAPSYSYNSYSAPSSSYGSSSSRYSAPSGYNSYGSSSYNSGYNSSYNSGYQRPSYNSYQAPRTSYNRSYQAPRSSYNSYQAPRPSYNNYQAPRPSYNSYQAPRPSYNSYSQRPHTPSYPQRNAYGHQPTQHYSQRVNRYSQGPTKRALPSWIEKYAQVQLGGWDDLVNPVLSDLYSKTSSDYKEPDYVNSYGQEYYDRPSFSERIQAHGDNMEYGDNMFQMEYNMDKIVPKRYTNYYVPDYNNVRPTNDGYLSFTERIHYHADSMEYDDAEYQMENNLYELAPEYENDIYDHPEDDYYQADSYDAPSYDAPSYDAPSYSAPSYSAPSYSAPSYDSYAY